MWYINKNLDLVQDGEDDYTRDLAVCRHCGGLGRLYDILKQTTNEIVVENERQCEHCHGTGYVW